ncbi:MAG: PilZ domain-containing protein [Thermodesulfobacteriota bacterium]
MDDEKRRFSRVPFRVKMERVVDNEVYAAPGVEDLSIGGCRLPVEAEVNEGDPCRIKIFLSGTNSKLSVKVAGTIRRREPGFIAVKFNEIEPDSLFHLQNIIRFNHPDAEKVEQEIEKHPGVK